MDNENRIRLAKIEHDTMLEEMYPDLPPDEREIAYNVDCPEELEEVRETGW